MCIDVSCLIYLYSFDRTRLLRDIYHGNSTCVSACEVPKTYVIFSHGKHMCLGHVLHMWNFTYDFSHMCFTWEISHLKFHMWNFTCEISCVILPMGNFIWEKSNVIFHMWKVFYVLFVQFYVRSFHVKIEVWNFLCKISQVEFFSWWAKSPVKFLIIGLFTFQIST